MAPSPSSQQQISSALLSDRNVSAKEDDQPFPGMAPLDEVVARGYHNRDAVVPSNADDDISVSESGSYSTNANSGGSESSPSMRSSSKESSDTGVLSRIAGHSNEEDRRICGARCLFFLVLLVAAVSLGSMVFIISSRNAHQDFEDEVRDYCLCPLLFHKYTTLTISHVLSLFLQQ
jgi:hypothetical protein